MDKYEMKLSIEEIKDLVNRKKFKQASDLAKTLNWQKVKDWSALSAAITAHENAGELEEARDMAILAYNRNLGGKKLVYELTTLMMKLKQFEEADELFLEYEKMASRDVNRYILYYELRKAEGAPSNELVEILEDYKKEEIDEKYMYELAKLYSKTGRKKECVKACDEIALLFQDGTYVVKALKMKQFHGAPLTEVQQQKLDEAKARRADMEITREILFQQQMDTTRFTENQEAEINEMIDGTSASRDTVDVGSMLKEASNQAAMDDDVDYTEFETELDENGVNRKLKRFILAKVQEAEEAKKAEAGQTGDAVKEAAVNTENGQADGNAEADYTDADSETAAAAESGVAVEGSQAADGADADETGNAGAPSEEEPAKIGEMPESLKDLIANAKKKIESSYDKITKESEQEKLEQERAEAARQMRAREDAMQIEEVAVPGNNIYDTQNLQAEIAKNLSAVLDDDELEQDVEMFRPNPAPVPAVVNQDEEDNTEDEQIEGIRIAGKVNSGCLDAVAEAIHPGMNTQEIDDICMQYCKDHNAHPSCLNYEGFPKSVCTSINEVVCHGIPKVEDVLKEGDIVNVDMTLDVNGYYGDASRMFIIGGHSTPEKEQLVRVTKECLDLGAAAAVPYCTIGDIGHAIQKHAEKYGYGVVRDLCGHGVGLAMHEEPDILHYGHRGEGMVLVPGMVFTIEPMINMGTWKVFIDADDPYGWEVISADELPSAQWEHTFLMTDKGVEILSE